MRLVKTIKILLRTFFRSFIPREPITKEWRKIHLKLDETPTPRPLTFSNTRDGPSSAICLNRDNEIEESDKYRAQMCEEMDEIIF